MNFVINNAKPFESAVKANRVLWRLYSRSFIIYILVMVMLAIALITFGCITKYSFVTISEKGITYYNFNLLLSLGMGFFIVAIIYLRNLMINKKAFFEIADKYAAQQPLQPMESAIEINEESIKVNKFISKHEYRWEFFSYFKFTEGILFLLSDNSYNSAVSIHQAQMDSEEFASFFEFVKHRFVEKK